MTMWIRALLGVSKHKFTVWVLLLQLICYDNENTEHRTPLLPDNLQIVDDCQTPLTQDFSSPVSQLLLLGCIYRHQVTFS